MVAVGNHEQPCDTRVYRQPRHDLAVLRELALRIEGTEQVQKLIRVADGLGRRRVDERKLLDRPETQRLQPQQYAREARAEYLGLRVRRALREILLGVQPHT